MPVSKKLHIYEEQTNLIWGLVVVATTASATFILANTFVSAGWQLSGLKQVIVLFLFAISFIGIFKISEPLLQFIIYVTDNLLVIKVHRGDELEKTIEVPLAQIEALKFSPHNSRSKGEAMFDFSTNYHIMWKSTANHTYKKLIDLESTSFTLKVEDIIKIIRLVREHNPNIKVPAEQSEFFGV